jgi:methyl-accepting chemotaxis protein
LALNASIEAGRLTDQSRFGFIAQQIRTLAMNSADAAGQITDRIQIIQKEMKLVVEAINQSTDAVMNQRDKIVDAGASLQSIAEVATIISDLNAQIQETAQMEAKRTTQLADEMTATIGVTDNTREGVQQIVRVMDELAELATTLERQIGQFILPGDH